MDIRERIDSCVELLGMSHKQSVIKIFKGGMDSEDSRERDISLLTEGEIRILIDAGLLTEQGALKEK